MRRMWVYMGLREKVRVYPGLDLDLDLTLDFVDVKVFEGPVGMLLRQIGSGGGVFFNRRVHLELEKLGGGREKRELQLPPLEMGSDSKEEARSSL